MSLYIIHLSDIHIKGSNDLVMSRINCIKESCAGSILDGSDVVLAITGDVAYSGKKDEYSAAKTLIDEISDYLKKEKSVKISHVIVPGNHDCNFTKTTSIRKTLLQSISPDIDETFYDSVSNVQSEFFSFANSYETGFKGMIGTKEIETSKGKVLFLLINTAWMSTIEEQHGKIILPKCYMQDLEMNDYKMVFSLFHHPESWFDPNHKQDFTTYIRKNSDIVLVGHEHIKDSYQKKGNKFSLIYNHGKELQDSNSTDSEFSLIEINDCFNEYQIYDFVWNENEYNRIDHSQQKFDRNRLTKSNIFVPNKNTLSFINDLGVGLNHFSKEQLTLGDLYVWPELNKVKYHIDKKSTSKIKEDIFSELNENKCNIIIGTETSGKTAMAKCIYAEYSGSEKCCIYVDGDQLKSDDPKKVINFIEKNFIDQYQVDLVDAFRRLSKNNRILIIDNYDKNRLNKEKQKSLFKILSNTFNSIYLYVSSEFDLTSLFSYFASDTETKISYYEILPLGNKKRKELIEKWYRLGGENHDESEIEAKIENGIHKINTFLGNGAGILPANPLSVLIALTYSDSMTPINGSQYGFLYETMIQQSLATILKDYKSSGDYNVDIGIMSQLAFHLLKEKRMSFSYEELSKVVDSFNIEKKERVSASDLLRKMCDAKLLCNDLTDDDLYRFKYPYVFCYFAGRYIAYHQKDQCVKEIVLYMCERLYIEMYGNIMVFVCHFANSSDFLETILINASILFDKYENFDFSKNSSTAKKLADIVDNLVPKVVSNRNEVEKNKEKRLSNLDDIGLNDGTVHDEKIDDDILDESDKELASISSSLKTMEVLGQILQNYPADITGSKKIEIITEVHNLAMRTVQAMISMLNQMEDEVVDYIVSRSDKDDYDKQKFEESVRRFIRFLTAGMARGMIAQIASAFNSKHLLPAFEECLISDNSISAKLVYAELKVNKIKSINFNEIEMLKNSFEKNNEKFALCILSSIMSTYLNYNECDFRRRSKICSLFGFSERSSLISRQSNLLEEKI